MKLFEGICINAMNYINVKLESGDININKECITF